MSAPDEDTRPSWHLHECDGPDEFTMPTQEAHRILRALQAAAGHLAAVDESNAAANLAEVRHRPLTREVILVKRLLDGALHPSSVDTPDDAVAPTEAPAG